MPLVLSLILAAQATPATIAPAAHAAASPVEATEPAPPSFTFVGQPDCVELTWTGTHTELRNHCDQGLLVDQSVILPSTGALGSLIAPDTTTLLRDLSAFTIGFEGELFRARAVRSEAPSSPAGSAPAQ